MSQADRIATLEYRVAELEAMLARVTRERDILLRRHENPANQQPPPQQQPHPHHRPSHHHEQQDQQHSLSHHDPTASVHAQAVAGEEKSLNDVVTEDYCFISPKFSLHFC